MATYRWSPEYVEDELNGAQGWVWYNWALEHETSFLGGSLQRTTPGYVQQERDKILTLWQAKQAAKSV